MIRSIRLHNIQSHPDTAIDLTDGLNVIVGLSDAGKSAIMRALLWAITGRPLGDGLCRRGEKEYSVAIKLNCGAVITRRKTTSENQYIVEAPGVPTETFNAVGKDVPQEIQALFNMDIRTQVHRQKARPFLLDESSGDVSRFINEIARLDDIDASLKWLNSDIRSNRQEETRAKAEQERLDDELKSLWWIDVLLGRTEALEVDDRRIGQSCIIADELGSAIDKAKDLAPQLNAATAAASLKPPAERLQAEGQALARKRDDLGRGRALIATARRSWQDGQIAKQTALLRPIAEALSADAGKIGANIDKTENLYGHLVTCTDLIKEITKCENEARRIRSSLPAVCPECGQPIR